MYMILQYFDIQNITEHTVAANNRIQPRWQGVYEMKRRHCKHFELYCTLANFTRAFRLSGSGPLCMEYVAV